jgi:NAD(P)-dependent dehydrogenase (short-subunit alcohol dehydrogenase family)
MDLQLSGKRALVTGRSRGLGKAVAQSLLDEGANVVVAARNLEAVHEAVRSHGSTTAGRVHWFSQRRFTVKRSPLSAKPIPYYERTSAMDASLREAACPERPT